jgi:S1-C subfamily serine protease
VRIEPTGCAGVLAEGPDIVLTARHCIDAEDQTLDVRFTDGSTRSARVAAVDAVADQVVLVLRDPVAVAPLALVRRRQVPGTVLYFEGNPKRPRFQGARLERIGRCESLPGLPNALFTSIDGVPGDSGAPLVDVLARVVGLVHGGAGCRIATPADTLGRLVDRVLERHLVAAPPGPPPG